MSNEKPIVAEMEATLTPVVNKINTAVIVLYEKLEREYNLTREEILQATVTIHNGEVTVKTKPKKESKDV